MHLHQFSFKSVKAFIMQLVLCHLLCNMLLTATQVYTEGGNHGHGVVTEVSLCCVTCC